MLSGFSHHLQAGQVQDKCRKQSSAHSASDEHPPFLIIFPLEKMDSPAKESCTIYLEDLISFLMDNLSEHPNTSQSICYPGNDEESRTPSHRGVFYCHFRGLSSIYPVLSGIIDLPFHQPCLCSEWVGIFRL